MSPVHQLAQSFSVTKSSPQKANEAIAIQIEHAAADLSPKYQISSVNMQTFIHADTCTYTAIVIFDPIYELTELDTSIGQTSDPAVEHLASIAKTLDLFATYGITVISN